MAELLAALAIIGILAAAASPVFVRLMRDGRVTSAANQIAEAYRTARSRALGRGACVLVRFDDAHAVPTLVDPAGHLTIREAIAGKANVTGEGGGVGTTPEECAPLPTPCCACTDWNKSPPEDNRFVASFDERTQLFAPAAATLRDTGGGPRTFADIAFSPRGRTFVRYGAADDFVPLRGVVRIEVRNQTTGLVRHVLVPPNGGARVVTRMAP